MLKFETAQKISNYAYCILCVIIIFVAGYFLGQTQALQNVANYTTQHMKSN